MHNGGSNALLGERLVAIVLTMGFALRACHQRPADPRNTELQARFRYNQSPAKVFELTELVGRDFFVCCNLYFDEERNANDANYKYLDVGSNRIPFGTRVKVTNAGKEGVVMRPDGGSETFYLYFAFGGERITAMEYFRNILRDSDPRPALATASPEIVAAITKGHLRRGMTKEQATMARGYPPFHRTPGFQSDQWLYYDSRSSVRHVQFVDGKIITIERGAAP
jgi:hypothetical protein